MNLVVLHVLERTHSRDEGDFAIAAPGLSPDERVVLWDGIPPLPGPEHPAIAPVVLVGELDGRRAYAEAIPAGVRMADHAPPLDLLAHVVVQVLWGLAALHAARHVHGSVHAGHVLLGEDGRVVLIGRGRRGGLAGLDLIAAVSLVPTDEEETLPGESAAVAAEELSRRTRPDDAERLAAWVKERVARRPDVAEQVVLAVGALADDAMDEVVPDLGPDTASEGILDRWSATTGSGIDSTPEVTAEGSGGTEHRLARELWDRLLREPEAPQDRFDEVEGVASRSLRALLADEAPETVPVPLVANVGSFAVRGVTVEDQPTMVGQIDLPVGFDDTVTMQLPAVAPQPRGVRWTELVLAMVLGGAIVWVLLELLGQAG